MTVEERDDHVSATVRELRHWLAGNLPEDWQQAVRAGDGEALAAITADPARLSAWFETLGAAGWATPQWPSTWGGFDCGTDVAAAIRDELDHWAAGRPMADFVGLTLGGPTILEWGSEAQKQRYLPPLARGQERWCQLFSEPGAGSDLAALSTDATRKANGDWVVTGQKVWSSFAHESQFGLLMARTDSSAPKHHGITYFLLDMHSRGVRPRPLRQLTGEAEFNEVFLDEVQVPDSARLGPVNEGWRVALTTLMAERSGLSGRPVVGPGATDQLARRARQTGAWESPVLREKILELAVRERALQMATVRAFVQASSRQPGAEGSIRKLVHGELTEEIGLLGTELEPLGAIAWTPGARQPEATSRFLAGKTYCIAGGTSEIQRNIIGERVLGLPKDADPERDRPFADRERG
ncbi:alkylation response protein AidB-like acyl-CoA dehydrogenase [Tamaricihabitans halophyticus]|uniref:Alkylation response protein AidB-like acyl-CoA dehydrogenase n=1 Tax=Tamaricihabitans halophyticus TaxID=1262583 RepID=A0A4R2QSJ2_9PSEU|nr:acyl-CoA dehydrogenase family protein [Tamaricihabitans halophyticus]TCP49965.1 alkylation response protein AidB-like acyl-CoA dehydrogenase [Tamaricihabitans halophyticus]